MSEVWTVIDWSTVGGALWGDQVVLYQRRGPTWNSPQEVGTGGGGEG